MSARTLTITGAVCAAAIAGAALLTNAGPLNPPAGPIAPTHKTLAEIEPRIPIGPDTTPGDADSLFKITEPGSYYLTGNVTGVAGKHGITIESSNVTLDLNGYTLLGVENSLEGVHGGSIQPTHITVRNGSVVGWSRDGVGLGNIARSSVLDVRARSNGGVGVRVGSENIISGCVAEGNSSHGIVAGSQNVIVDSTAANNKGDGFNTGASCLINGVTAQANLGSGVVSSIGTLITRSQAIGNGNTADLESDLAHSGIECRLGCTITRNTVRENIGRGISVVFDSLIADNVVTGNNGDGVRVDTRSLVTGNICVGNVSTSNIAGPAAGVRVVANEDSAFLNRIEGNRTLRNQRGIYVNGSFNLIVGNSASGNTINNYEIAAGNKVGVIVDAPASPAIDGSTGGAGLGTTDPWANFSF